MGIRIFDGPFLGCEKPVKPFKERWLLLVSLGEPSSMKWNFHQSQSTNSTIEQEHISNVGTRPISIFGLSVEIKVTHNEPFNIMRHLNVLKPVHELNFSFAVTRAIDRGQDPGFTIHHGSEFY